MLPNSPLHGLRAVALLLLAGTLHAQTASESIEVRLLEIEAAVVDRQGNPVQNLRQEDFEVTIGGKKRDVVNFFAVENGKVAEGNRVEGVVRESTSIPTSLLLFIDETRLGPGSRKRALEALQRYVQANVGPDTNATLVRYNNAMNVAVRPTNRPGYILNELQTMLRQPGAMTRTDLERDELVDKIDRIMEGVNADRDLSPDFVWLMIERRAEHEAGNVDRTLKALRETVKMAHGFAGRKVLLYVSEGLPLLPGADLIDYWAAVTEKSPIFNTENQNLKFNRTAIMRFDRTSAFQALAREAQRENVSFYSFNAAGARSFEATDAEARSTSGRFNTFLISSSANGGPQLVADQTGGAYATNDNDLDRVFARMAQQFTTYYSLAVRRPGGPEKAIAVKVKNRPDLRVITSRRQPGMSRELDIERNVRSRLFTRNAANPLGAKVRIGEPIGSAERCMASVAIQVPRTTSELMEMHFALMNARNEESEIRKVNIPVSSGAADFSMTLRVQPEKHVFSLAIADPASGETSYLQQELDGARCR